MAKRAQQKKPSGSENPFAVSWSALTESQKDRLLYLIVRWRIEKHLPFGVITQKVTNWVRDFAPQAFVADGKNLLPSQVGRFFGYAIDRPKHKKGSEPFVELRRSPEQDVVMNIQSLLHPPYPRLVVAPDRNELFRYVWEDMDAFLTAAVSEPNKDEVVLGISGGRTILDLANEARNSRNSKWRDLDLKKKRKAVVCSLASGGIRSDIAALSDTVAASIADYLGARARGLLGPAWFASEKTLRAFAEEKGVVDHVDIVNKVDFILASVGCIDDKNALLYHLLDELRLHTFLERTRQMGTHLADILYNCYDGITGKPISLPRKVEKGLFRVVTISRLKEIVANPKKREIIVVATGKKKGSYALPGLLRNRMANNLYMDRECAEALKVSLHSKVTKD